MAVILQTSVSDPVSHPLTTHGLEGLRPLFNPAGFMFKGVPPALPVARTTATQAGNEQLAGHRDVLFDAVDLIENAAVGKVGGLCAIPGAKDVFDGK